MLLFSQTNSLLQLLTTIVALLSAITIHEFSHAWVANYYGDSTAKSMGRLTLNPLAHLDLLGTIFLLIAGFGWGKPVIVNSNNFQNPKLDNLTVSLAGPVSNLFLATVLGLVIRFAPMNPTATFILSIIIFFNLVLMIFNLIPIPPLDGSKILGLFLSEESFMVFQQIGIPLLFGLVILSNFIPVIPTLMSKTVLFFFHLITGVALF